MQAADKPFALGPFQGRCPLGWVPSDTPSAADTIDLRFLGANPASALMAEPARVTLSLERATGDDNDFAVWPSAFSGWEPLPLDNGLWGQRARLPGTDAGRQMLVVRIPATDAVLLENGADAMLARLHLIRAATRSIRIQTFIWSDDEDGRLLLYVLAAV